MSFTIDDLCHQKRSYSCGPPLRHCFHSGSGSIAQTVLVGALLAPGTHTVTAALQAVGVAAERHFTNDHRVLNRATWSARQTIRILLGVRMTYQVPLGAPIVLGADPVRRRGAGSAKRYRDAGDPPRQPSSAALA